MNEMSIHGIFIEIIKSHQLVGVTIFIQEN